MKIIFMGTPSIAAHILESLCRANLTPSLVVTQEAKPTGRGQTVLPTAVEKVARQKGLPVLSTSKINTPENVARLSAENPDLILVVAFGQLLKTEVLQIARVACLNVHGSLLPKYRGAAPIQRAIMEGDSITGVTIQKMVLKLDAGDILLQKEIPIAPQETSESLFQKMAEVGGQALIEAVQSLQSGKFKYLPQIESEATYAAKLQKEEAILDFNQPAQALHRQIRGLQPWPVAEMSLGNEKINLYGAEVLPGAFSQTPGTLITDHKTYLHVVCGENTALSLTEIRPENRKKLNIRDYLNSFRGNFPFSRADEKVGG